MLQTSRTLGGRRGAKIGIVRVCLMLGTLNSQTSSPTGPHETSKTRQASPTNSGSPHARTRCSRKTRAPLGTPLGTPLGRALIHQSSSITIIRISRRDFIPLNRRWVGTLRDSKERSNRAREDSYLRAVGTRDRSSLNNSSNNSSNNSQPLCPIHTQHLSKTS